MDIETLHLDDVRAEAFDYFNRLDKKLLANTYVYSGFLEQEGNALWSLDDVINRILGGQLSSVDIVHLRMTVSSALLPATINSGTTRSYERMIRTAEFGNNLYQFYLALHAHEGNNIILELSNGDILSTPFKVVYETYSDTTHLNLVLGTNDDCLDIHVQADTQESHIELVCLLYRVNVSQCFLDQIIGINFTFQLIYDLAWITGSPKCNVTLNDSSYFPKLDRVDRMVPYLLAYGETFYSRSTELIPDIKWNRNNNHNLSRLDNFREFQGILEVARNCNVDDRVWDGYNQEGFRHLLGRNIPKTYKDLGCLVIVLV